MHAVLGVKRDAKKDGPSAVELIRDGFATDADAEDYIAANKGNAKWKKAYREINRQSYEGDAWAPCGGFCYLYARRVLIRDYDQVKRIGGAEPKFVVGTCNLEGPDGKTTRGGHAWVECGDIVVDCGAYLFDPVIKKKTTFYEQGQVEKACEESLEEVKASLGM
jgi:hypothetical protein